ncbi:MAG: hypothetical protein JNN13_15765 [Planctomycetes bacterium]|nr:hypothetical protein [Planctomycetota bacterium]
MNGRDLVRRRLWRALAAVLVCAFVAYGAAIAGDYVYDDIHSVSANPALHDLREFGRWWTDPSAFSGGSARMYRPALLTSIGINLWVADSVWSVKAGNVLLHALTAALLTAWLWRFGRRLRVAALVGCLFAAHPLLSEAINLVSARSELLSTCGVLIGLHGMLSWQRGGGSGALAISALGTVLACGSKETGVMLPWLAAAQAFCLRQRAPGWAGWRRLLLGLVPMLLLVAGYLVARKLLLGEATVQLLGRDGSDPLSGSGRALGTQLATMATLLPGALLQVVWPFRLSFDPAVTYRLTWLDPAVLGGAALLLGMTWLLLRPGPTARQRRLGAVLAWSIALPWILVPLNQPYAEHRAYGPLVGLTLVAAAVLPRLARRLAPVPRPVLRLATGLVLAGLVVRSGTQCWLYRDESELWRVELARGSDSYRSWWGLATSLRRKGEWREALVAFDHAHTLYPQHYDTLRNYVEALIDVPDADADVARTLRFAASMQALGPNDPWVRTLAAQAQLQAGRVRGEATHFEAAERLALSCLEIAPAKGYVFCLAAAARRGLGDLEGALRHLDESVRRGLAPVRVRLDRATVLGGLGRHGEARRELLLAQQQAPGDALVQQALLQLAAPPR